MRGSLALLTRVMASANNTSSVAPAAGSLARWPMIVLLGDSLTQRSFSKEAGWGALLADHVFRKCDVINRGFSGYNSRWLRMIMPRVLPPEMAPQIHMVTLCIGANDSNDPKLDPEQAVPLAEFSVNVTVIVEYLMAVGIRKERILIIGNPASDDRKWDAHCLESNGVKGTKDNKLSQQYAEACMQVATRLEVPYVDMYGEMIARTDWRDMLNDGLHFSEKGAQFAFQLIQPWLDLHTKDLPMMFPVWDQIDNENAAKMLCPGAFASK